VIGIGLLGRLHGAVAPPKIERDADVAAEKSSGHRGSDGLCKRNRLCKQLAIEAVQPRPTSYDHYVLHGQTIKLQQLRPLRDKNQLLAYLGCNGVSPGCTIHARYNLHRTVRQHAHCTSRSCPLGKRQACPAQFLQNEVGYQANCRR
jgi:hypothetical protein